MPIIGLHSRIAQKIRETNQRIADFSYVEEVDDTALEALRLPEVPRDAGFTRDGFKLGIGLTYR